MPRNRRQQSESGVYHVMIRGVDKMDIFLDEEDRHRFLDTLVRFKEKDKYELYAYCLMSNHVHLLIKEYDYSVSRLMKRVGVSYVYYFNHKYKRVGHLFQDRYKSENVDDEPYLLGCSRYIHNNPVEARLVRSPQDYRWSSYAAYLQGFDSRGLIDTGALLTLFANDRKQSIVRLQKFTEETNDDLFLEYQNLTHDTAMPRAQWSEFLACTLNKHHLSLEELRSTRDTTTRNIVLNEIKLASKYPLRDLSVLLGMSKDVIFRA